MGKHRGGDPQKSIRFARKALELYEEGLSKFPRNFDLAYNKARLELEIATHPVLVQVLDVPLRVVLEQSLRSHQYALQLDNDNADLLFNTAQVLTTVAENIANDDSLQGREAIEYLQQALDLQSRCLQVQGNKFAESRAFQEDIARQADNSDNDDGGATIDSRTTTAFDEKDEQEQWVSIVEPVTADSLLDTILAQFATLTTLCSVLISVLTDDSTSQPSISPTWLEEYSRKVIDGDLAKISSQSGTTLEHRLADIAISKANFQASLLELAFRSKSITFETYREQLRRMFEEELHDLATSGAFLIAYAKALMSLNSATNDLLMIESNTNEVANIRWSILSKAQNLLTKAASLDSTKADRAMLATTHILRGDTSLASHMLSYAPAAFPQAIQNKSQLLKNAEVFYRNAAKLLASPGGPVELDQELASFRSSVALALQNRDPGSATVVSSAARQAQAVLAESLRSASAQRDDAWRLEQLEDMVNDGLILGQIFGIP